jgi:RNA polymerase sigma-70 factor (ECF subfamily)
MVDVANNGAYEIDTVLGALMQLPPKFRIVLYLHYYEGYKLSDIADMLKLNINTVKTQIRTAKRLLKIELGDDFND